MAASLSKDAHPSAAAPTADELVLADADFFAAAVRYDSRVRGAI
jgi:hypothetical protein